MTVAPLDERPMSRADSTAESRNLGFMTSTSPAAISSTYSALPNFDKPTYLMCPPEWYDVNYVINPWMAGNLHRPSRDAAFAQWKNLYHHLQRIADIMAKEHAQLWINHDKPQSDAQKKAPDFYE